MIASWHVYGMDSKRYADCGLSGPLSNNRNYYWYGNLKGRSNFKLKLVVL